VKVRFAFVLCVLAVMIQATGCHTGRAGAAEPGVEEGTQVLTRGPVHEAFAETVSFNPEPGVLAPKSPPPAIEELPPDQRPEGTHVTWIPGYWAWDDERSDFLWVSGIWRALPPGRQWVPGYWAASGQRAQWTSGYWADAKAKEIEYLPEPPQSVEAGPNIAAPSADHLWHSGCWIWQQSRYAWRPGYWAAVQPDWMWTPAHYLWAPRGYVFVDGYWDYSLARRGILFAPVYFNADIYARRGFYYSPATVVDLAVFTNHLFLRPSYGHYYFGDYYASSYSSVGFYPSYSIYSSRHGFDPIYAQQRWEHRQDREWEQRMATQFQHRRDHEDARPPRTLAAMNQLATRAGNPAEKTLMLATSLDQMVKSKDSPVRFQPVDKQERQKLAQHGQEVQRFREERQKLETSAVTTPAVKSAPVTEPIKVKLPTAPIVAKPAAGQIPPKIHEVPKADPKIEPKLRKDGGTPGLPAVAPKPPPKGEVKPPPRSEPKPPSKGEPKPPPKGGSEDKPKG
jgi:WXXGXW repeat (2 copies)